MEDKGNTTLSLFISIASYIPLTMSLAFSQIETDDQLDQALHFWKNFTFSEKCIRLQDAIDTIGTDTPLVEAKHVWTPKWIVRPSVLHTYFFSDLKSARQMYRQEGSSLPYRRRLALQLSPGHRQLCAGGRSCTYETSRKSHVSHHHILLMFVPYSSLTIPMLYGRVHYVS